MPYCSVAFLGSSSALSQRVEAAKFLFDALVLVGNSGSQNPAAFTGSQLPADASRCWAFHHAPGELMASIHLAMFPWAALIHPIYIISEANFPLILQAS